ncbi:hypothetical protein SUNI508_02502 [Seiridium unicorne]|uniref:EthD domain-containing protein n=1 Tax=Seiridium unicorne TaxID=138068 RepID=A0ABR2UFA0_9PEZI
MSAFITVAYPRPSSGELKFDLNYYLDSHMPLVAKTWAPNGLKSWTVTEHARPVPPSQNAKSCAATLYAEGPYAVQAILQWESIGAFDKAAGEAGAAVVFGDIPKFTDIQPLLLKGDIKGSWTA